MTVFYSAAEAFPVFMRYRDECARGIVHTPKWVEEMKELEASCRKTLKDLSFLNRIEGDSDRLESRGVEL